MKTLAATTLTVLLAFLSAPSFGADHPELKAFPAAEEGMERIVIVLPHKGRAGEGNFKVEIVPGKTMLIDGVNKVRFGTKIESRPLKGWGYTFYEVTGRDIAMSTLMAVPGGAKKKKGFVSGTPLLIRYNSRLPVVVYVPKGQEVRYRIWEAPKKLTPGEKG